MLFAAVEKSFQEVDTVYQKQAIGQYGAQRPHLCLKDLTAFVEDCDGLAIDVSIDNKLHKTFLLHLLESIK